MRRFSLVLAIILILITLSSCKSAQLENSISIDNISEHIEYLTSSELEGRLMGTEGNQKAIDYISSYFEEVGLKPVVDDSFTKDFKGLNVVYSSVPVLKIIDNYGNEVDTLFEGDDFKIRLDNIALGGSFKGAMKSIDDKKYILRNEYNYENFAVLIDYQNESIKDTGLSEGDVDERIYFKDAEMIIYPEHNNIRRKDINLGRKNNWGLRGGLIKVGLYPEVFDRLVEYSDEGYEISVDIPVEFNEIQSTNVLGMIEGKVKNYNNIIIATSFDGLGLNSDGDHYPGAVDNASSVALLLELSRILSDEASRIDSNIYFLAINGNKLGDRGFDNFFRIQDISHSKSKLIYLDKLGTIDGELTIGTFTNSNTEFKLNRVLFNQIAEIIEDMDISFIKDENFFNSDYTSFRMRGIPGLVLTHGSNERTGTILDNRENLSIEKIFETGNIVLESINPVGNINLIKELGDILLSTWYLLLIGLLLVVLKFVYFERNSNLGKLGSFIKNKPVVSIYLFLLFYIIIIILQAKHSLLLSEGILMSDISVDFIDIIFEVLKNILTTGPMIAFSSVYIAPLLLVFIGAKVLSDKFNISKLLNFLIIGVSCYLTFAFVIQKFISDEYTIIFPKLLSLPNAHFVVILIVALYTSLLMYSMNREIKDLNRFKLTIIFVTIFFIYISVIYSPLVFNKSIINIRSTGGRVRL